MKLSIQNVNIELAANQNIPALKHIWKTCFGDSEVDIMSFFDNAFGENTTLIAEYDDDPVGMLTMLPCKLNTHLRDFSGFYLYSIAVMPEYRGNGLMRAIEAQSCQLMEAQGADFACLVPGNEGLFSAYEKLGYKVFSRVGRAAVVPSEKQVNIKFMPLKFPEFSKLRGDYLGGHRNSIRFTENYEKFAYYEYLREGGKIFRLSGLRGYICAHKARGILQITETSVQMRDLQAIAAAILDYTGTRKIMVRVPGGKSGFAMLKPLSGDLGISLTDNNYFGFALE